MSVVLLTVPVLEPASPDALKTTVKPVVVRLCPAASFACSVSVAVDPDAMLALDVVTADFAVETVTVSRALPVTPAALAEMVATPVVPDTQLTDVVMSCVVESE